jgi:protein-tyrosine phosphatase
MAPDLSHPDNAELVAALRDARTPPEDGTLTYPVWPADADRVHGGLWMGGWPPPGYKVGEHFDCLVLCAREYQVPELFGGVQVAQARLDDSGVPMRPEERPEAVRAAGKVIRWLRQDLRVLVTCFAGRNRSGLVSAIALCKGPAAMSPDAATAAIRAARGDGAFRNPWFEAFLRAYCRPT